MNNKLQFLKYNTSVESIKGSALIKDDSIRLSQKCMRGFVLEKDILSSKRNNDGVIRAKPINLHLIDYIVRLLSNISLNIQIPAYLYFLDKEKEHSGIRKDEILSIDAITQRNIELSIENIKSIAYTCKKWKKGEVYQDLADFYKSLSIVEVTKFTYVLTPCRYVGLYEEEFNFEEKVQLSLQCFLSKLKKLRNLLKEQKFFVKGEI